MRGLGIPRAELKPVWWDKPWAFTPEEEAGPELVGDLAARAAGGVVYAHRLDASPSAPAFAEPLSRLERACERTLRSQPDAVRRYRAQAAIKRREALAERRRIAGPPPRAPEPPSPPEAAPEGSRDLVLWTRDGYYDLVWVEGRHVAVKFVDGFALVFLDGDPLGGATPRVVRADPGWAPNVRGALAAVRALGADPA